MGITAIAGALLAFRFLPKRTRESLTGPLP